MAYFMVDADPSVQLRSDLAAAITATTAEAGLSLRRENTAEWHNNAAAVGTLTVVAQVVSMDRTTGDETVVLSLEAVTAAEGSPIEIAKTPAIAGKGRYALRVDQSILDALPATHTKVRVKATLAGTTPSVVYGAWIVGGDQPVTQANGLFA
jgi:hypothetical protein